MRTGRLYLDANCGITNDLRANYRLKKVSRGAIVGRVSSFSENVRRLRGRAGLRSNELAAAIGVRPSVVSRWETSKGGLPETPTLLKLAKALRCTVEELLVGVDVDYDLQRGQQDVDPEIIDVSGYIKDDIPVIAEGEASPEGSLFWDEEGRLKAHVTDRVSRPFDLKDPHAYGVRVRGDSMIPAFRPGMIVIVSPNIPIADGDEGYVQLKNGERLIKVVHRMDGGWVLESWNPAYPARVVKLEEVSAIHPVIYSRRSRRGVRVVDKESR